MVVVPTLVPNAAAIAHLLETIEIHHLANRDPNLHFGLLTDFSDAAAETLPEDAGLREELRAGIAGLNRKYGAARNRRFSSSFTGPAAGIRPESRWMGYERKRGKIAAFNAMLRGGGGGRRSATSSAIRRSCRESSSSSRSTPTPSCRRTPPASSSARWPIP